MRGVVVTKVNENKEVKNDLSVSMKKYLIKPIASGIFGYLGFFALLMISKYLGYIIGNRVTFKVDITDLLLSLMGFAFIFVIKLRENSKGRIL